jgi:hypothetical protein
VCVCVCGAVVVTVVPPCEPMFMWARIAGVIGFGLVSQAGSAVCTPACPVGTAVTELSSTIQQCLPWYVP